ncbi:signal peptidase I [Quadrisphaera sp. DSM 44207]|uniref:signal peptidase I n=1 Tax=Quadrisphaera sp. DSM 44207 TaxID=1881057 RepID=UPI00088A7271|nr:signal peptidase I [Quadrisphaera sp. DSM 44207]SDQ18964.1 signal peptidase I [Quadrisphaera sp. DSM 44207]
MTDRRPALRHASTGLLVLALAVLVLTLVAGRSGYRLVAVWTGSMAPAMPAGSLLLEELRPTGSLRAGDVITFHEPTEAARVLTHRVVEVAHTDGVTRVQTQGDANPGRDPWDAELLSDGVWVVVASAPHLGRALGALRSGPPWAATSVLAPALLAAAALRWIWRAPGPRRPARRPAPRRPLARAAAHSTGHRRGLRRAGLAATAGATVVVVLAVTAGPAAARFAASASRGHAVRTAVLVAPTSVSVRNSCVLTIVGIDVRWTGAADDRAGYRVERRTGSSTTWTAVGTAAAGATSYRDTSVFNFTQYTYRVLGTRGAWSSAPSAPAAVTTGTC